MKYFKKKYLIAGGAVVVFFVLALVVLPKIYSVKYVAPTGGEAAKTEVANQAITQTIEDKVLGETVSTDTNARPRLPVEHIATPVPVKAVYLSSYAAGTPSFRKKIVEILDTKEINSVVIDIKDYSGRLAFETDDPELQKIGASENRIPDVEKFVSDLHSKGVYVIGRISSFQDPYFIKLHPEIAVKKLSDKNSNWKDKKGISWIDASSQVAWDYLIKIAEYSYGIGFDELNFDYIRFPSDGNMKDIYFPISQSEPKAEAMKKFFVYLSDHLRKTDGIKTSADVFGMVATNMDDLNIGQLLENFLPNFDYIAPMVYPSHYPATWNGFKNPATHPYEVIKICMDKAVERAKAIGEDPNKIRPWLQDFNMGAKYTPEMIKQEMKAVYDAGLDSWMLWDPANTYTESALSDK